MTPMQKQKFSQDMRLRAAALSKAKLVAKQQLQAAKASVKVEKTGGSSFNPAPKTNTF
jgi:hypothetical protein